MSAVANTNTGHVWVDVQRVNSCGALDLRDVASLAQQFMDTRSLKSLALTSRGTYHAYKSHLDKRLVLLFELMVSKQATHREVMEALRQIPAGETGRVVTQFNTLLASYSDLIRNYLFERVNGMHNVRFRIPAEVVPFETREGLVRLCSKICMKYSYHIVLGIQNNCKDPASLRFLLSVSRNLREIHPERSEPKLVASVAAGCLLALDQTENNGYPQLASTALKAQWNTMSAHEQAQTLLALARPFASIHDLNHPVVSFVNDFIADKGLIWADPAMQEACVYLVQRRISALQGNPDALFGDKLPAIAILLNEMSNPSSNNDLVKNCISKMIREVLASNNANPIHPDFEARVHEQVCRAQMGADTPSVESIGFMLCRLTGDSNFLNAFDRFKKAWHLMPAFEQARALLTLGQMAYYGINPHSPAAELIGGFVEDGSLGWADLSMQRACAYLLEQRVNWNLGQGCDTIHSMLCFIAYSTNKEDLEKVYRLLSKIVDQPQDAQQVTEEWVDLKEELAMKEFSPIITTEPQQDQAGWFHRCNIS